LATVVRVKAAPFIKIIANEVALLERGGSKTAARDVAWNMGIHSRIVYRFLAEGQENIEFATADKIVCGILGEHAWHCVPELNEIYEALDFSPTVTQKVAKKISAEENRRRKAACVQTALDLDVLEEAA
jgi:hypothetical protein